MQDEVKQAIRELLKDYVFHGKLIRSRLLREDHKQVIPPEFVEIFGPGHLKVEGLNIFEGEFVWYSWQVNNSTPTRVVTPQRVKRLFKELNSLLTERGAF